MLITVRAQRVKQFFDHLITYLAGGEGRGGGVHGDYFSLQAICSGISLANSRSLNRHERLIK